VGVVIGRTVLDCFLAGCCPVIPPVSAVVKKIQVVFWAVIQHNDVVGYQHFRGCCLHLYPEDGGRKVL